MTKTLCFDLDGTLCSNTFGDYQSAEPFPWAIRRVNALARAGHRIVILTARGSATGVDWRDVTRAQLECWSVDYDELVLGKPSADVYVDDRAVNADAWQAADAFAPPGFGRAEDDALPASPPSHVSCVVETGRTFGGRPVRLLEHVRRAQTVARRAGLGETTDPVALAGWVSERLAGCEHDVAYSLTLAGPCTAAHLDLASRHAMPTVAVACRGLDEIAHGLAPLVVPDAGQLRLRARVCADPARPADAWPLRSGADGSIADGLDGELGIVSAGTLRLPTPSAPAPVAAAWLRSLAADAAVPVEEAPISLDDLAAADEALVAGLPFCVLPIGEIDGVAVESTGAVTARLLDTWSADVGVDLAAQTAALVPLAAAPELIAR